MRAGRLPHLENIFPLVKIAHDSRGNTQIHVLYTSVDCARNTWREMATLFKFFKKQSTLPTSKEVELPDAVTREVNSAMRNIIESNGASGRKRKYTHFTPETRARIAKYTALCGNTAAVKHFANDFPTWGERPTALGSAASQRGQDLKHSVLL